MSHQDHAIGADLSRRATIATYGTAFFSLSMVPMTSLVVPLWALQMGASPLWIGIVVGARSFLPLLLSIHGGVLMDRLGTRRVMAFFALMTVALYPLYPLMPWLGMLIVLQLLIGLAVGLSWVGAQTLYGRLSRGDPTHASRLTFFCNAGAFAGPLVVGGAWDLLGPSGAFGLLCLWGASLFTLALVAPKDRARGEETAKAIRISHLYPDIADYRRAFTLMALPVVAMVMAFTFLRISVAGVQSSFYVVYLESIRFSGAEIGLLVGCASFISCFSALLSGRAVSLMGTVRLVVSTTAMIIIMMSITPFLQDFFALLVVAAFFGFGVGIGFPPLLILLSQAVAAKDQGISVGLRTTFNRLASLVIPIVMGFTVELWGIGISFVIVGVLLLAGLAVTALVISHVRPDGGD